MRETDAAALDNEILHAKTNAEPEIVQFAVHQAILNHLIHSQAGTPAKAMLELIQNAVDAGATECHVTISETSFGVSDNGRGFASRQEIDDWFRVFGAPHQDGDATFGRFRLGRGQIMSFAATTWLSNRFRMEVDIQKNGMQFELVTSDAPYPPGCQISGTWYKPLANSTRQADRDDHSIYSQTPGLTTLVNHIVHMTGYLTVPLTVNGERVNRDPAAEAWDKETDDAWIRVHPQGVLQVYNQGVFVRDIGGHHWGCGGVVVSKKPIMLNISRTHILEDRCPVWGRIDMEVDKLSYQIRKEMGLARMDENGRMRAAKDLIDGRGDLRAKVITILPYEHISLVTLADRLLNRERRMVLAPDNDLNRAEKMAMARLAIVMHRDTGARFNVQDPLRLAFALRQIWDTRMRAAQKSWNRNETIPDALMGYMPQEDNPGPNFVFEDYKVISDSFDGETRIMDVDQLTPAEQRVFRAMKGPALSMLQEILWKYHDNGEENSFKTMTFRPGRSATADAWTDGFSYIAVNEKLLHRIHQWGVSGLLHLLDVLIHELCHGPDCDSTCAPHDPVFHARYHEWSMRSAPLRAEAMQQIITNFLRICAKENVRPPRWTAPWEERRRKISASRTSKKEDTRC